MTAHEYVNAIRGILAGSRYACEVWVDALHVENPCRLRVAEHYDVQAFATAEDAIAATNRWASKQTIVAKKQISALRRTFRATLASPATPPATVPGTSSPGKQ